MKNAYRRVYNDPRVNEAYSLYVDGKASLKVAADVTGAVKRTLERRSTHDGWKAERAERLKAAANSAAVSAVAEVATMSPTPTVTDADSSTDSTDSFDGTEALETKLLQALTSADTKTRHGAVLIQQRAFFDELMTDARSLLAQVKAAAEKRGAGMPVGQMLVVVGMGEKIATQQRKAHGIPDMTKLEMVPTDGLCASCTRIRNMTEEELDQELEKVDAMQAESEQRAAETAAMFERRPN